MGKRSKVKKRKGLEKSQNLFCPILDSKPHQNHQRAMLLDPAKCTSHFLIASTGLAQAARTAWILTVSKATTKLFPPAMAKVETDKPAL
jgi:hypothetical protein